jgi:hypothetical protein
MPHVIALRVAHAHTHTMRAERLPRLTHPSPTLQAHADQAATQGDALADAVCPPPPPAAPCRQSLPGRAGKHPAPAPLVAAAEALAAELASQQVSN